MKAVVRDVVRPRCSISCMALSFKSWQYALSLFGFRTNLALHFERSTLNHSYGYASSADRPNCLASFALNPESSCNIRASPNPSCITGLPGIPRPCLPAVGTTAGDLQGVPAGRETGRLRRFADGPLELRITDLGRNAAGFANEKRPRARVTGPAATHVRIERRDSMHQAVLQEKFKRTIYGGRRRRPAVFAQHAEDVVSTQRPVTLPDDLQHPPAQRRQSCTAGGAHGARIRHCLLDTDRVVVPPGGKGGWLGFWTHVSVLAVRGNASVSRSSTERAWSARTGAQNVRRGQHQRGDKAKHGDDDDEWA